MCVLEQPREQGAAIQSPADPLSTRRVVASIPAKVYMDGSDIAKRPTELCYLYAPQIHRGAFAPPLVVILVSLGALWVLVTPVAALSLFNSCVLTEKPLSPRRYC